MALDMGDQGTLERRGTWGKRLDNGLEILVSASDYKSRGEDNLYFREFDDPLSNNGDYKNNDGEDGVSVFTKLGYRGMTLKASYSDRTKEIPTASYGTVFNSSVTETTDELMYLDFGYTTYFDSGIEWGTKLNYGNYEYTGDYLYNYPDEGDLSYLVVNKDETENNGGGKRQTDVRSLSRTTI